MIGKAIGCKATGEEVLFRGITWVRVAGGKMIEGWQSSDVPLVVAGLQSRSPAGGG